MARRRARSRGSERVYYAHATCLYGSEEEASQLRTIRRRLRPQLVLNPAEHEYHPEKLRDTMGYCFKLIDSCDSVVFSRLLGRVTSGVGKEVNYALEKGRRVYELRGTHLVRVRRPVTFISRGDTVDLYEVWRRARASTTDSYPLADQDLALRR